jgi:hypothetical protein
MAYTDWLLSLQKQVAALLFGKDASGNVIGIAKAEDVAHADGDVGFMALGVRKDTAAALAGADGDYIPLIVDASGRLHVALSALQKDDTDKLAVSVYGKATAAGDTPLPAHAFRGLYVAQYDESLVQADAVSNTSRIPVGADGGRIFYPTFANLFNGTSWDRQRGNVETTLLASAARTATTNSADQVNYNHRGLILFVDVTARAGTTTLTPSLQVKEPVGSNYITVWTAAAAINSADTTIAYLFYPSGLTDAANLYTEAVDLVLSRTWRLVMTHSDGSSITYSASCAMIL